MKILVDEAMMIYLSIDTEDNYIVKTISLSFEIYRMIANIQQALDRLRDR